MISVDVTATAIAVDSPIPFELNGAIYDAGVHTIERDA
jgi:hypothetical protein